MMSSDLLSPKPSPASDTTHAPITSAASSSAMNDADSFSIDFDDKKSLSETLLDAWQSALINLKHSYVTTADSMVDEVLLKVSEKQINDALTRFVTNNVGMILNLRVELHEDWLRLFCTVDYKGLFTSVACNFRLVTVQINADMQRFVFEQLSDTDVLELHSRTWWQAPAAMNALRLYRTLLHRDPLGFILHKITVKGEPFASYKGNIIYLDIHRYLLKQTKMLNTLKKVQVNDGSTKPEKMLLKVQLNFAELLSFGDSGEDIITDRDNPNQANKSAATSEAT